MKSGRNSTRSSFVFTSGRAVVPSPDAGIVQGKTREADMDLVRIIAAIFLPPLGVFLQVGLGKHFWINIVLTLLGYIPGIVHAVWVIAKK